jgi:hypothetical protein
MPNPSRSATAFVVHTPRMRIIRMSTSGCGDADSLRTQSTRRTRPAAITPSVFADSQCHVAVSLTATSTRASPADISAAPVQLTRPGTRTGDSGTKTWIAIVARTIGISGSQKR